jgi:cobalt-zinc-cadmium efflux system outer membrane protein
MTSHASRFLLLALPLIAAGCKTNPTADFQAVQKTASARTGLTPEWPRSAAESEKLDARITQLLANELTPDAAVQIALLNNRSLRATFEEIGISRAELLQASLPRNPRFFASFRFPDRPPSAADTEFSIAGDFMDLLLLPLRKRVAGLQLEQVRAQVSHEILQVVAEAKDAFYTVQARQQLINRLQAIVEVNEAGADLAMRQHKAGNITDLDLANHQAAFQQAKLEWGKTSAQLRTDRERLNRVLGVWGANTQWKVASELPPIPSSDPSLENLETRAIEQRFDLAAARQQADLALRAFNLRARTKYLPASINLGVDTERGTDRQRVTGPTLDLELPIFDQGQAAIAKLGAEYRQAQWRLEALATDIRSEVRQARDTMLAARDLAEFYQKIYLPQRIRIVNETVLQYDAMQKGTYDLIAAKERELSAERDYAEAWKDYWIARAHLEKAIGGRLEGNADAQPSASLPAKTTEPTATHQHKP